jgi:hypothetical protein
MGSLHITNKDKMLKTLERFHNDNETKTVNKINDKCTVKLYIIFDTLILKYTNRVQSQLWGTFPAVTSLSHKLRHNQHARVCLAFQLHKKKRKKKKKKLIIRTRSHPPYVYCNSISIYTKYLSLQNHLHVEKASITTPDTHSLNIV